MVNQSVGHPDCRFLVIALVHPCPYEPQAEWLPDGEARLRWSLGPRGFGCVVDPAISSGSASFFM